MRIIKEVIQVELPTIQPGLLPKSRESPQTPTKTPALIKGAPAWGAEKKRKIPESLRTLLKLKRTWRKVPWHQIPKATISHNN